MDTDFNLWIVYGLSSQYFIEFKPCVELCVEIGRVIYKQRLFWCSKYYWRYGGMK